MLRTCSAPTMVVAVVATVAACFAAGAALGGWLFDRIPGGMRLLSAIADDIREHGPLHTPEFVTCKDCGAEFEPPISADLNTRTLPVRCADCRRAVLNARRNKRRKSA